jgi:hypothetical protein
MRVSPNSIFRGRDLYNRIGGLAILTMVNWLRKKNSLCNTALPLFLAVSIGFSSFNS